MSISRFAEKVFFRILLILAVISISTVTLMSQPMLSAPAYLSDKVLHGLSFFILSLLADYSIKPLNMKVRKSLWLLAFGLAIEAFQYFFTKTRSAEFLDVVADIVGIGGYWLLAALIQNLMFWRKPSQPG